MHVDGECVMLWVDAMYVVATEHGRYTETVVCRNCMQYAETVSSARSVGYVGSFNFML